MLGQQTCRYIDPRSGLTYPLDKPRWSAIAVDGSPSPLLLTPLPGIKRSQIVQGTRSLWRYAAAFPMACERPISLGEGCTPLVRRPFGSGGGEVETQRALGRGAGRCASSRRTR